ncbi:hypothetical protein Dsin_007487 [Dipteronia sinensis]|uniref:Disease resistance protein At4g27190-like leucine-rich repeats domain-containing protein n=1 Tax=Dipteronia sinensis TaxID=43782 RepID=A0AAE0B1L4_9ROSI|nr:hypothetical protein Dsin_007487 [Dipteronia sinensis]
METFINNSTRGDMATIKKFKGINSKENTQPLFNEKVELLNLHTLLPEEMDSLKRMWHDQLSSNSFYKLRKLIVSICCKLLNVIPYNMLERLLKLEKLTIAECDSTKSIFELQTVSSGMESQGLLFFLEHA